MRFKRIGWEIASGLAIPEDTRMIAQRFNVWGRTSHRRQVSPEGTIDGCRGLAAVPSGLGLL